MHKIVNENKVLTILDKGQQEFERELEKIRFECSSDMGRIMIDLYKEGESKNINEIQSITMDKVNMSGTLYYSAIVNILVYNYYTDEGLQKYMDRLHSHFNRED